MSDNISQLHVQKHPGLGKRIAVFALLLVLVAGGELATLPEDTGLASIVETPEPIPLLAKQLAHTGIAFGKQIHILFAHCFLPFYNK